MKTAMTICQRDTIYRDLLGTCALQGFLPSSHSNVCWNPAGCDLSMRMFVSRRTVLVPPTAVNDVEPTSLRQSVASDVTPREPITGGNWGTTNHTQQTKD